MLFEPKDAELIDVEDNIRDFCMYLHNVKKEYLYQLEVLQVLHPEVLDQITSLIDSCDPVKPYLEKIISK